MAATVLQCIYYALGLILIMSHVLKREKNNDNMNVTDMGVQWLILLPLSKKVLAISFFSV